MRVLLVGGAGYVGGLVLPVLRERHEVRVLDQRAEGIDHVTGDATDYATVRRAGGGTDAGGDCAMGGMGWETPLGARGAVDVSVRSGHPTPRAGHDAGGRRAADGRSPSGCPG